MDVDDAGIGDGGKGEKIVVYVLWEGVLEEGGDAKVAYEGGPTKCMLVKVGVGVEV